MQKSELFRFICVLGPLYDTGWDVVLVIFEALQSESSTAVQLNYFVIANSIKKSATNTLESISKTKQNTLLFISRSRERMLQHWPDSLTAS